MKSQQNTDILKITPYPFVVTKYCILQLYVHNISEVNKTSGIIMSRLYSVKTDIFQNSYFWCFFIRNNLSRTDLIIRVVSKFLSNL